MAIPVRTFLSQKKHDEIVRQLFQDLCAKGYENVTPSHGEMTTAGRGEKLYSEQAEMYFCPDICARKAGAPIYFEVETEDSIDSSVTRVEIECFLSHAKKVQGYFYLVVPDAIKGKAASLLQAIDDKDVRRAFVLPV